MYNNNEDKLVGYFVKNDLDSKIVYLAYDKDLGLLDYYEVTKSGGYNLTAVDLTADPNYAIFGFTPDNVALGNGRFFGWGEPHLEDGPCMNGQRAMVEEYYVFWIGTGETRAVLDNNNNPIYAPCE